MSSPSWRSALSSAVDCWGSAPSFNLPYESLLRCTSVGHGRGAESSDRNWVLPALGDRASHRSVAGAGGIQCAHVGAAVPAHQRRARPPCPSSSSSPWVRALLHSTFDQPDAESVVANMIGCPCTIRRAAEGGRAPRWRPRSAADLRRLPQADLALDLVSQSRRMPQQGDPSPRRRRHLPRPQRHHPPRRRRVRRTTRQMDRRPPLPRPRRTQPVPRRRRRARRTGDDHHTSTDRLNCHLKGRAIEPTPTPLGGLGPSQLRPVWWYREIRWLAVGLPSRSGEAWTIHSRKRRGAIAYSKRSRTPIGR